MWVGLSRFEKSIPRINIMHGLRLRQGNIQIGNDDAVQDLFRENRGNYYFVGEIFAVDKSLIPNSQRNYFNENETRVLLEDALRIYFYDVLHKLYYDANRLKNAYKKQEDYLAKVAEFNDKKTNNSFIDDEAKQKLQYEIEKAKQNAEDAVKQLQKMDVVDEAAPISEVYKSISRKFNGLALKKKVELVVPNDDVADFEKKKSPFMTSSLSRLSKSERKIVSKIYSIIADIAPRDMSEMIINRIQEELR
jgi:molecular chaperone HtpG